MPIMKSTSIRWLCREARPFPHLCGAIGGSLCNDLACAMTKVLGRLITIKKSHLFIKEEMGTYYRICED